MRGWAGLQGCLPKVVAALAAGGAATADETELYPLGPESYRQEDVPRGKVTRHVWRSEIFAGTVREFGAGETDLDNLHGDW
ncbi:MAG TPA: hypothetical protein VK116_19645 [Planctomycetota bacterium]|nr:hypothetical protein [Planctomycetota bacterium]